jgi:hypothetical protein
VGRKCCCPPPKPNGSEVTSEHQSLKLFGQNRFQSCLLSFTGSLAVHLATLWHLFAILWFPSISILYFCREWGIKRDRVHNFRCSSNRAFTSPHNSAHSVFKDYFAHTQLKLLNITEHFGWTKSKSGSQIHTLKLSGCTIQFLSLHVQLRFINCHTNSSASQSMLQKKQSVKLGSSYPSFSSSITWVTVSSLICQGSSYNRKYFWKTE